MEMHERERGRDSSDYPSPLRVVPSHIIKNNKCISTTDTQNYPPHKPIMSIHILRCTEETLTGAHAHTHILGLSLKSMPLKLSDSDLSLSDRCTHKHNIPKE